MTITTATRPTRPARWPLVAAGLLHLLVLWPYLASGLVAPGWAVLSLLLLWAVLGAALVQVHSRWGALALLLPPAALALWFGALTAGEQLLGWTG